MVNATSYRPTGDRDSAIALQYMAERLLAQVQQEMSWNKLPHLKRSFVIQPCAMAPTGAEVIISCCYGVNNVHVFVPSVSNVQVKEELEEKTNLDSFLFLYEDCTYHYQYVYDLKTGGISQVVERSKLDYRYTTSLTKPEDGYFPSWTLEHFWDCDYIMAGNEGTPCNFWTDLQRSRCQICPATDSSQCNPFGYRTEFPGNWISRYCEGDHRISWFLYQDTELLDNADWPVGNVCIEYGHKSSVSGDGSSFYERVSESYAESERDPYMGNVVREIGYAYCTHCSIVDVGGERKIVGVNRRADLNELVEYLERRKMIVNPVNGVLTSNYHYHYRGDVGSTETQREQWSDWSETEMGIETYNLAVYDNYSYFGGTLHGFNPSNYCHSVVDIYPGIFYESTVEAPYFDKVYDAALLKAYQPLDYLRYSDICQNVLDRPFLKETTYGAYDTPLTVYPKINHAIGVNSSILIFNYISPHLYAGDYSKNEFIVLKQVKKNPTDTLDNMPWENITDQFMNAFEAEHGAPFNMKYFGGMILHKTAE
jgi:hypothetical protein